MVYYCLLKQYKEVIMEAGINIFNPEIDSSSNPEVQLDSFDSRVQAVRKLVKKTGHSLIRMNLHFLQQGGKGRPFHGLLRAILKDFQDGSELSLDLVKQNFHKVRSENGSRIHSRFMNVFFKMKEAEKAKFGKHCKCYSFGFKVKVGLITVTA